MIGFNSKNNQDYAESWLCKQKKVNQMSYIQDDLNAPGHSGQARGFRIQFAQDSLNFRDLEIGDPVPLGRQILAKGGLNPNGDYSLFAILDSGEFEDIRLDEPVDLRATGVERFVAFQTDRDFKFTVQGNQAEWGKPAIPGSVLYALASPAVGEAVFLEVRGGEGDRQIEQDELVDLTAPGVERFITAPKRKYDISVNGHEVQVDERRQTFEQLVAIAFPGEAPSPETKYSITYRRVASVPHSGELAAGGFIKVKNGSIINVNRTVQS